MEKEDTNNFEAYIGKVKRLVKEAENKFSFAREFCGHRNQYNTCRHDLRSRATYCKLSNCPLMK